MTRSETWSSRSKIWNRSRLLASSTSFKSRKSVVSVSSLASSNSNSIYNSAKSFGSGDDYYSIPSEETIVLNPVELVELKKSEEYKTGIFGAISVIICCVVGAGIFISPQDAFIQVKSTGLSLIIYASMGMHVTIGAMCFAELGTTFPVSGGDYAYIKEAFGSFLAFQFQQMSNLVFIPCINAIAAQTAGRYLLALVCTSIDDGTVPINKFTCGLTPTASKWTEIGIGVIFIILSTVANFFNGRYTKKMVVAFTIGKLLGCVLIITLGVIEMIGAAVSDNYKIGLPVDLLPRTVKYNCSDLEHLELPEFRDPEPPLAKVINVMHAVYFASFSYIGWNYLNFLTKELQDPVRHLPIAICTSLPLVTAVYVLINISCMAVLSGRQFVCTTAMAYDTLNAAVGEKYEKDVGWIATILVMLAAMGGLFGHMEACCRLTMVGAQNGHWPPVFKQVHVTQLSPIPAVIFQCFMSMIYAIIVGLLHPYAILMACYCENTFSALAVFGLVWMRFRRPGLPRPIKLWIGIPIFYCVCASIMFLIPILDIFHEAFKEEDDEYQGLKIQLFVVGVPILVFLLGTPAYFVCIYRQPWPGAIFKTNDFLLRMFKKTCRLKKSE